MDRPNMRETPRDVVATISGGVTVTGEVASAADLQIDGRVVGDVRCATLFLGEAGAIAGTVHAERVRVSGSVDGTIHAGDLAIEATGRVKGDVSYARLKVSAGAIIEATLKHRASDAAGEPAPLKLVEADVAPPPPRRVYGD